eukprot:906941_1
MNILKFPPKFMADIPLTLFYTKHPASAQFSRELQVVPVQSSDQFCKNHTSACSGAHEQCRCQCCRCACPSAHSKCTVVADSTKGRDDWKAPTVTFDQAKKHVIVKWEKAPGEPEKYEVEAKVVIDSDVEPIKWEVERNGGILKTELEISINPTTNTTTSAKVIDWGKKYAFSVTPKYKQEVETKTVEFAVPIEPVTMMTNLYALNL